MVTTEGHPAETDPHVVVIGAGFAGVACPRDLGRRGIAVTLIDTNTYHSPSTIHRDEVTPVDERVTETRSPSDPPPSTQ